MDGVAGFCEDNDVLQNLQSFSKKMGKVCFGECPPLQQLYDDNDLMI
jgi:hypothetical protein